MSNLYVGVNNTSKKSKTLYIGDINNTSRKIKKIYAGNTVGKSETIWKLGTLKEFEYGNGLYVTTNDFESFNIAGTNSVPTKNNYGEICYRNGFIYRIIDVNTGTTYRYTSYLQRKKIGGAWENLVTLATNQDQKFYLTYNKEDDQFVITRADSYYYYSTSGTNEDGAISYFYAIISNANFTSINWSQITAVTVSPGQLYVGNNAVYRANGYMYMSIAYHGSAGTNYPAMMKTDSSNWTKIDSTPSANYPTQLRNLKYFKGRYFGKDGVSAISLIPRATTDPNPASIVRFSSTSNNTLTSNILTTDSSNFFIVNNTLFYIVFSYTSAVTKISVYKSTDGVTFSLAKSLDFQGTNPGGEARTPSSIIHCGEDSDNFYYVISFSNSSGTQRHYRPVEISKTTNEITLKPYFAAHAATGYDITWGLSE